MLAQQRQYNSKYHGENLNRLAFPLGGIGAGMICLEGTGAISHVSLRHKPDLLNEPQAFSAICIKGAGKNSENIARVLEGPVPDWKIMNPIGGDSSNAGCGATYGLPRFSKASFEAKFPFATVSLADELVPVEVKIIGWSPFTPGDADDSSLPVVALEFHFKNKTDTDIEAVYSFNSRNFMAAGDKNTSVVRSAKGGFEFYQSSVDKQSWQEGSFCAAVDDSAAKVNCAWFRGGWFDPLTRIWEFIAKGEAIEQSEITEGTPSPGATIYVPFTLSPGQEKTIRLRLGWFVPKSDVSVGKASENESTYRPWYTSKFSGIDELMEYWQSNYGQLRQKSEAFSDCFYDTTLPDEVVEAVAANLTILKSPTCLRQADGRFWGWEGCGDSVGSCHGTCTHVWNYAQAMPHLFPSLERTIRQTEHNESLSDDGFQSFRTLLPIRETKLPTADGKPIDPNEKNSGKIAAADGQLGSIMRLYREWRISGDTEWLKHLWPKARKSLDYCIKTWDPQHRGVLVEPQHNTYDIEFWGPNGMCSSFYLGALKAAVLIGRVLDDDISVYESLFEKGKKYLEEELFDGEYFFQKVVWEGLRAGNPMDFQKKAFQPNCYDSPESKKMMETESPKYQYGTGCLSDGVIGAWMAEVCGIGKIFDAGKIESHLLSVYKYNFKKNLSEHSNPQRPTYALGDEGGLLLCSWPKGGEFSLPFVYSNEVWTGIEYQVASHLMMMGHVDKGLEIVRACRNRYDGRVRNPFNEYECGHWYARAMSSYALLQALTGVRYDTVEKTLYITPKVKGDFRAFISTATGFGTVGIKNGEPFLDVKSGNIEVERTAYKEFSVGIIGE